MISSNIIFTILIPLLSLLGLLGGVLLSYIAQEELPAGRKYFAILYRIIFITLLTSIIYFLSYPTLLFFLLVGVLLIILDLKKYHPALFVLHYLFFLTGYFIAGQELLIAAILFLYGLPVGTLLRTKSE